MGFVYLLHFDRAYAHARHYLGYTENLAARLERHRAGNGARLVQVINQAGITWQCVRVWERADRELERRLKRQHNTARFCPLCRPEHLQRDRLRRRRNHNNSDCSQ